MKKILILTFLVSFLFACGGGITKPIYSGKVTSVEYIDGGALESDLWLIKFENGSQVNANVTCSDIIEIGKTYNVFKPIGLIKARGFCVKKKK